MLSVMDVHYAFLRVLKQNGSKLSAPKQKGGGGGGGIQNYRQSSLLPPHQEAYLFQKSLTVEDRLLYDRRFLEIVTFEIDT